MKNIFFLCLVFCSTFANATNKCTVTFKTGWSAGNCSGDGNTCTITITFDCDKGLPMIKTVASLPEDIRGKVMSINGGSFGFINPNDLFSLVPGISPPASWNCPQKKIVQEGVLYVIPQQIAYYSPTLQSYVISFVGKI